MTIQSIEFSSALLVQWLVVLIQPKFLSLTDLLANRLFRIPQYQRSYSWSSKERQDMFEDIDRLKHPADVESLCALVQQLIDVSQRMM